MHPKTAQVLARHSTITLTMDGYTHHHAGDEVTALSVLPDLSVPPMPLTQKATGTDGVNARHHEHPQLFPQQFGCETAPARRDWARGIGVRTTARWECRQ